MPKFGSLIGQYLANEQTPMAMLRVSLAAEQRDSVAARTRDEALDRQRELRRFGHGPVEGVAFGIVMLLLGRTTSELFSEKQIAHALACHRRLDLLAIEMWREARVRIRAHVNEKLDLLTQDEPRKGVGVVI
jgi:hypothetical protein